MGIGARGQGLGVRAREHGLGVEARDGCLRELKGGLKDGDGDTIKYNKKTLFSHEFV